MTDAGVLAVTGKICRQLNPLFVSFSGGEPLLRADLLLACINTLKNHGVKVHLNTNGLLLTAELCRRLRDVDKINVNVDSPEKDVHDRLRGQRGAFDATMRTIEFLKKSVGPGRISIAVVITKSNLAHLVELGQMVKREGFMELHLLDMVPTSGNDHSQLLSREEWLEFYGVFEALERSGIKIKPNHGLLFLSRFRRKIALPFCMAGRMKMVICANGNIVPCNYFKNHTFLCGNALHDDLKQVWMKSDIMLKFRQSDNLPDDCQVCNHSQHCAGGCKAMAQAINGSPFAADPYCTKYGLHDGV